VGCYRSPVSVGTCGYFDSDPCLDLRFSPCPPELPICDTGTRSCVECIGGIECAPAIEACVSHTCTPPAGTCYEGVGTTVTVPALTAMGDISVFLGMRLPARMLVATIFLRHPDGMVVDIRTSALGDGYVDSMFTTVTGATQPEIAALSTLAPGGRWELQIIPVMGFPAELVTWAVCVD
jgi:hypothetical protein